MKKVLLSLAAILFAAGMNAQSRTNLWEGEQTMDSGWPSVIIEKDALASAKAGDNIVVTISKADNSINTDWAWGPQIFINVTADEWANLVDVQTATPADGTGESEYAFELSQAGLDQINAGTGIAVQGMNVVVVKIELEGAIATTSTAIWEGECAFGNWEEGVGISIEAEKFATANEGDVLEFIYTIDAANPNNWFQFKTIFSGTAGNYPDDCLTSNFSELNEWGCATVASAYEEGTKSYKIVLNADDIAKLKETGLFTNGYYLIVSQVNLIQPAEATGLYKVQVAKAADDAIYNIAGQKVNASYKGLVIKNGKKYFQK